MRLLNGIIIYQVLYMELYKTARTVITQFCFIALTLKHWPGPLEEIPTADLLFKQLHLGLGKR